MFGIGLPEMILILALALIVVGPDKLPELARSVAKGVLELKKTVSSLKENLAEDNPFDAVKPELEEAAKSLKNKIGDPAADVWKGLLPNEGVNPDKDEADGDVIETEILSEKDQDTVRTEDSDHADPHSEQVTEPAASPSQSSQSREEPAAVEETSSKSSA